MFFQASLVLIQRKTISGFNIVRTEGDQRIKVDGEFQMQVDRIYELEQRVRILIKIVVTRFFEMSI